jgi:hypothetical protein
MRVELTEDDEHDVQQMVNAWVDCQLKLYKDVIMHKTFPVTVQGYTGRLKVQLYPRYEAGKLKNINWRLYVPEEHVTGGNCNPNLWVKES